MGFQSQSGRDSRNNSYQFLHIDRLVSMSALLTIIFFIIYLIVAWASLISNLRMLETYEYFRFFRNSFGQSERDDLLSTGKTSKIVLVTNVAVASFLALMYNLFRPCLGRNRVRLRRWPDGYFGFLALITLLAFFPYFVHYRYGAVISLVPEKWSEIDGRYLRPPVSTPAQLMAQWQDQDRYATFLSGVVLLDLCIMSAAYVFMRVVVGWLPPRVQQNRDYEQGHELRTIALGSRHAQPAAPVRQASEGNAAQFQSQVRSTTEVNLFGDANEASMPQRPAQTQQRLGSNPFDDTNETRHHHISALPP